jgi:molybdopterin synthase sulfur carrier subunit
VSVKVNLHPYFTHITEGKNVLEVEGKTVGQCLEDMVQQYPELKEWLYSEEGDLSNLYEVYVNMESAQPERLAKPVRDGDEIHIVIIIAGG